MSATDPRVEAAAGAIFRQWYHAMHPAMRTTATVGEWTEQAMILAAVAIAAADAVDGGVPARPFVDPQEAKPK